MFCLRRTSVVWAGVVSTFLIACSGGVLWGQGRAKQVECSGVVVDSHGRPVAGAEVVCSEQFYEYAEGRIGWRAPSRTSTGENGRFQVRVSAERSDYILAVAWKKGLALGWQWTRSPSSAQELVICLCEPAPLAGVVVDESGQGVAGATVRPCLKMDWMDGSSGVSFQEPREWFAARTDDQGRFRFDHIPVGATADFWVQAPGKASCWTYWEEFSDLAGSRFKAGQTDIRIVLKSEAVVRGQVIDEDSGKGVAGIRLVAHPNVEYASGSCIDPVTSGPDGSFVYRGLTAAEHSLRVLAPQDRMADWVGRDVKVAAVAGQTVDANVPVGKGGLVEVTVQDAATGKPVENARVNVREQANSGGNPRWVYLACSNADGLARLRAPAGECRLVAWADAYDYFSDPEPAIIASGEVLRCQARLDAYPAVAGIVRDSSGRPAAGVIVNSRPICAEPVRTDEQGRFRVRWRPSPSVKGVLVLARDPDRNLAGLADVKDQSQPVDVTLVPAFVVRGRITDPNGKAIPVATVLVRASMPGWYTDAAPAVFTDANGVYEARAMPAPTEGFKYEIEVQAQGYGPTRLRGLPFDAAQNRQVNVETIVLPVADKSISGVVVDANGVPAPGLPIFITGPRGSDTAGQPSHRTVTDKQGRFAVDGACAGPLRIQAGLGNSPGGAGFLDAQGGDRDVKVVLGRSGVHVELTSLLGKPLPDWKGLIDLDPQQVQGKPILLCFFDMDQRPSRRCIDNLAAMADSLKLKGVTVAAVQATTIDENAWKSWIAERRAQFSFARIEKDPEKAKFAWGIQSLPWLILTDAQHVVRAEGFNVSEIDRVCEKIK